jgi:predicted nucleotidyltransferase component of viral defense system
LDFFFDGYKHSSEKFDIQFRKIIYKIEPLVENIEIPIESEFFKRIFIKKNKVDLKIEFILEKYKTIGEKKKIKNFFLDTKENICANKITAVQDRKTFKDFFDLFFLLKEISLEQAIEWAQYKIVPLDYEGVILAFDNAFNLCEGDVLSLTDIPNDELKKFILNLIGDLINYARKT